ISRSQPYPGDLIITREAPMGEVCIIPDGIECCLGQRLVLIKPNLNKINNKYLLYALLSEYTQKQIQQSNNTGSIVSNLRIPLLKNLDIPLNNNQDKIAAVLSYLDDKIEINNRINSELENLAKTIYDYWFVQFDFPDENGKPYKSSGGKMVYNQEL
ncbi:MAG: restriction endonuclease subunit S, partial [Dolichospermum sp.]